MAKDKFLEASVVFSQLIENDHGFEAAYLYRGLCFIQLEKYKLALKDFNYLTERHPKASIKENLYSSRTYGSKNQTRMDFIDAYFQRGVTKYFMDSLISAKRDFEFVLSRSNRIPICRNYLANIYYLQGDHQNACAQIRMIKRMSPKYFEEENIDYLKKLNCQ